MEANFTCQTCGARLYAIDIPEPFTAGEVSRCPNCNAKLPPRDADKRIYYKLISVPAKRPRDPNQLAKRIVDIAIGDAEEAAPVTRTDAQKFASQGGLKGGKARAESLTPARRAEIARSGAKARWASKKP